MFGLFRKKTPEELLQRDRKRFTKDDVFAREKIAECNGVGVDFIDDSKIIAMFISRDIDFFSDNKSRVTFNSQTAYDFFRYTIGYSIACCYCPAFGIDPATTNVQAVLVIFKGFGPPDEGDKKRIQTMHKLLTSLASDPDAAALNTATGDFISAFRDSIITQKPEIRDISKDKALQVSTGIKEMEEKFLSR